MNTKEKFEFAIEKMIKETDPRPMRFEQLIHETSILETCRKLLESDRITDGFTNMVLKDRIDLTVEYIVATNQEFQSLFTEKQVSNAKERVSENRSQE